MVGDESSADMITNDVKPGDALTWVSSSRASFWHRVVVISTNNGSRHCCILYTTFGGKIGVDRAFNVENFNNSHPNWGWRRVC